MGGGRNGPKYTSIILNQNRDLFKHDFCLQHEVAIGRVGIQYGANPIDRVLLIKRIERTTEKTRRRHGFFGDRWMVVEEGMECEWAVERCSTFC